METAKPAAVASADEVVRLKGQDAAVAVENHNQSQRG